jgi:hypothetical protein
MANSLSILNFEANVVPEFKEQRGKDWILYGSEVSCWNYTGTAQSIMLSSTASVTMFVAVDGPLTQME